MTEDKRNKLIDRLMYRGARKLFNYHYKYELPYTYEEWIMKASKRPEYRSAYKDFTDEELIACLLAGNDE